MNNSKTEKGKPSNMLKKYAVVICLCFISFNARSQEKVSTFDFSGYITEMPSVIFQDMDTTVWWENLIHNRLNFSWTPINEFSMEMGMRNRFIVSNLTDLPGYADAIGFDRGWMDLSWNIIDKDKMLLNTTIDRLFMTFEKGRWNLKIGRQRVNWGQNLVWNPNDIFNTYSYFDFDYVERPGSDAFRGTYYHNETSSTELAVAVNHEKEVTAALLHRWNRKNFDYQVIGGILNQSDVVVGGAWSGDFSGLNFRGECSYFQPTQNFADTTGIIAVSIGVDYIFKNSLMLQTEILYNNVGDIFSQLGFLSLYAAPLSAKYLSICDWTFFGQASYPITPRLTGALSAMLYAEIKSYYLGLSIDYSLLENLDASLIGQFFQMNHSSTYLGFFRLKYSF